MAKFRTAKQISDLLGLSTKALRLYEKRGLIAPGRTTAGWRVYGPQEIAVLHKVQTLKLLGFSLLEISKLLSTGIAVDEVLEAQEVLLEKQQLQVANALTAVQRARTHLATERSLSADDLIELTKETVAMSEHNWTEADQKLADRHYTREQLEQITQHKMSPEFQVEVDELWDGLLTDIERLKSGPADTPEALDIARRWLKASDMFHKGDPELMEASNAWYEDGYARPETAENMPFPKETWEFAKACVAALEASKS